MHPPALPDDDLASDMLDLITARAPRAGLQRYEVSAFARDGPPLPAQPELLAVRRLPGHRRRRARQAELSAPRAAPAALARAGALHGAGAGRPGAVAERARWRAPSCPSSSCSMRCACAKACRARCSANAPGCRPRPSTPAVRQAEQRGLLERRPAAAAAHRARLRLPQRPAGAVPAGARAQAVEQDGVGRPSCGDCRRRWRC